MPHKELTKEELENIPLERIKVTVEVLNEYESGVNPYTISLAQLLDLLEQRRKKK